MERPEHPMLSPRNFWQASVYLILLGVLSSVLLQLNNDMHLLSPGWLAAVLLVVVALGGYRLFERVRKVLDRGKEVLSVTEAEGVRGAVALIAFVSQGGGRTSAFQAAEYHAKTGSLRHLWFLTTRAAEPDARLVADQLKSAAFPDLRIHEVQFLDDKDSIIEAKRLVEHLRGRAMGEFGIPERDVICDFTGLTKNASAGMILACAPRPARLQYMVPNRVDDAGRADVTAGSRPREVFIQYTVVEEG